MTLHDKFVERTRSLKTMGFTQDEIRTIAQSELSHSLTNKEWSLVFEDVNTALRSNPIKDDDYDKDLNVILDRMDYVSQELLIMFQNVLANHNAMLDGKAEHDPDADGYVRPVIPVKAMDVAALGEKIIKMDTDRLAIKLKYPAAVTSARNAGGLTALPSGQKSLAERASAFTDDGDEDVVDVDFEETE